MLETIIGAIVGTLIEPLKQVLQAGATFFQGLFLLEDATSHLLLENGDRFIGEV
jgi:hypothetical protein